MKRLLILILLISVVAMGTSLMQACPITFINDTQSIVFAFDAGYNEGNILKPGDQHVYGANDRHPDVTLYLQSTPESAGFKKSYRVEQKQCAMFPEDKIIKLSLIIANDRSISTDIYAITNYTTGMDILTCCGHPGSEMDHAAVTDEPLSTMDEE